MPRKKTASELAAGPQRLNKILAAAGLGSRRSVDELIETGRVEVDGVVCDRLGTKVDAATAKIFVDGEPLNMADAVYYAVNKPAGVLCTNRDPQGRPRAVDLVPTDKRLFCIGRLDQHSTGLLLLTNDGTLAQRLTHPKFGVQKKYRVLVAGAIDEESLAKLRKGIYLAEGKTQVDAIKIRKQTATATDLEMILSEGKNREIRRVLARFGHKVLRLQRIAVGPVKLATLAEGEYRLLTSGEIEALRHLPRMGGKRAKAGKGSASGAEVNDGGSAAGRPPRRPPVVSAVEDVDADDHEDFEGVSASDPAWDDVSLEDFLGDDFDEATDDETDSLEEHFVADSEIDGDDDEDASGEDEVDDAFGSDSDDGDDDGGGNEDLQGYQLDADAILVSQSDSPQRPAKVIDYDSDRPRRPAKGSKRSPRSGAASSGRGESRGDRTKRSGSADRPRRASKGMRSNRPDTRSADRARSSDAERGGEGRSEEGSPRQQRSRYSDGGQGQRSAGGRRREDGGSERSSSRGSRQGGGRSDSRSSSRAGGRDGDQTERRSGGRSRSRDDGRSEGRTDGQSDGRQTDRRSSGPSGPRSGGPRSSGPRSGGPRSGGPRSDGPRSGGPRSNGPRSGGPRSGGPKSGGPGGRSGRPSGPRAGGEGGGRAERPDAGGRPMKAKRSFKKSPGGRRGKPGRSDQR